MRPIITMLFLISLAVPATCINIEQYNSIRLNMSNGMPSNSVNDIFTDSNGFVWIATYGAGLLRYDGYTVSSQSHDPSNNQWMMGSNSCLSVSEDKFHRLWTSYDEFTQVIELSTMLPSEDIYNNVQAKKILKEPAHRVYRDRQGKMWVVTTSHIYAFSFDFQGGIRSISQMTYSSGQLDVSLADINGDGTVWAGINGTVYRLYCKGRTIISQPVAKVLTNMSAPYITSITRQGNLVWVGSNNGLFRFNLLTQCLTHYMHLPTHTLSLNHNYVSDLAVTRHGELLIGTLSGVDVFRGNNIFYHWTATSPVNPLTSNFVKCIMVTSNQIWVGTENCGIDRLLPHQLQITNHIHSGTNSLSAGPVNSIYAEDNGTLWVGTVNSGLSRKAPGSRLFQHWNKMNSSLTENTVSVLTRGSGNLLWIGTWGGGIHATDIAHPGKISQLRFPDFYQNATLFVGSLSYDESHHGLWIGANNGIFFYDLRIRRISDPFRGNRNIHGCIGSIITRDNHLFIGHLCGMTEINLQTRKVIHHKYKLDAPGSGIIDKITCFCQTKDGTLWLGSNEYGLYKRVKHPDGHSSFVCYTTKNGLSNNAVKGIVEDRKGILWITTVNGLSRFNPQTEVFTNYDTSDGLCSQHFYWNSAVRARNGLIYLGTECGLIELKGEYDNRTTNNRMHFTSLEVNGELVLPKSSYLEENITNAHDIYLQESDRSFTISFSALDYENSRKGIYSYRMQEFDDEWIKLTPGEHSIHFTRLPAGNYILQVRHISPNSPVGQVDNGQLLTIHLHVKPYFWHSWWFITLVIFILAVIAIYLYNKRVQMLRQRTVEELYKPIEKAMAESNAPERLQKQIQDIINTQRRMEASTESAAENAKPEPEVPFMERVMTILEKNYQNSEFGVNEMSTELGMSRSVLGKRLNEETGMSAAQFLRHYRLDIAYKLFTRKENGDNNVANVAFKVGFNDPKYFTRCFTKEYGFPPSRLTEN